MRRYTFLLSFIILVFLLALYLAETASAEPKNQAVFRVGQQSYCVNDNVYEMDVAPFIEQEHVYIPLRFLAHALGLNEKSVTWSAYTGVIEIILDSEKIKLFINEKIFYINDKQLQIDVEPVTRYGQVFLTSRPVAGALGYAIAWDKRTNSVLFGPPGQLPEAGSLPPVKSPLSIKSCQVPENNLTAEKLVSFREINFPGLTDANVFNAGVAAKYVSGVALAPGEEFSFNKVVGNRIPQKGFITGKDIWGYASMGGGVCRTATILFQIARAGGLTITERHPHALPVHYAAPGTDATVSWGQADLRFKNNRPFTLVIYAGMTEYSKCWDLWAGLWERRPVKKISTAILKEKPGPNLWKSMEPVYFDALLSDGITFVSLDQLADLFQFSCEIKEHEGILTASAIFNNQSITLNEGDKTVNGINFQFSEPPFRLTGSNCKLWVPLRDWVNLAGGEVVWVTISSPLVLLNLSGVPVAGRTELNSLTREYLQLR